MLSSQSVQELSITQLHLSKKVCNVLIQAGITTVGQFLNTNDTYLRSVKEFNYGSIKLLKKTQSALQHSLDSAGELDWIKYLKIQEIELIPDKCVFDTDINQIIQYFNEIIKEVLKQEFTDWERAWIILQRRFALENTEKLSLEDLGHIFSLTRERVRQIEEKTLIELRNVFFEKDYSGKKYHLQLGMISVIDEFKGVILNQLNSLRLESELLDFIKQRFNLYIGESKEILSLLFSILGICRLEFDEPELTSILGFIEPLKRKELEKTIKFINIFLTEESPSPKTESDTLLCINKKLQKLKRLSLEELRNHIDLCSSIERCKDNCIWGKFEYLKGRGNQIERLLIEYKRPMSIPEITREINYRLVPFGQRKVQERNIRNQLCNDKRFIPIGKSGQWGLKGWDHLATSSIIELMEEFFLIRNEPATVDEVYSYVSERRPVSKKSITTYLGYKELSKNKFARIDRTRWGLSVWKEATNTVTWNPEQVAEFVASLFRKRRVKELNYKSVKQALMEAASITDRQAQGLLNVNPVIKTHRDKNTDELLALFQPDYKNRPVKLGTKVSRKNATLRDKIDETVRGILEAEPEKQVPLSELVKRLKKKYSCPTHTVYQYISHLDYVERLIIPGSRVKMCRIKETSKGLVLSKVQDIYSNTFPTQFSSTSLMHILHLSDLHITTPDNANLWSNQLAADLYNDLSIPHLDALILSGDIANYSTEEEYQAAQQFLHNLCQDFTLNPEQIILVPGNHDLNWKLAKKAYKLIDRDDYDGELTDDNHIKVDETVIRVRDEAEYKQRFAHFSQFYETIKQNPYPLDYDQQYTLDHRKEQNLLILGLNSAWQLDHHYKSRASIHMGALSNALTQIRRNPEYKNCLKIAVWHHPLDSAYSDRITDQGFLEQLAVNGFRFFLHGHIHKAETSLYRYDTNINGRKLDRICAGTFGAPVREWVPGYPLQYNLLKIEDNQLTVITRRREELNGAWKPDARWLQGAGKTPLDYYAIDLS